MSDSPPVLQFETAEGLAPGHVTCATCSAKLTADYHQLNGQAVCAACRTRADVEHERDQRLSQVFIALVYGFGACLVGALLYWGFVEVTGIEVGLMAIAVGWLVGKAVMRGSNRRGGRRYQVMAVALTYLSICLSYGAIMVKEALKNPQPTEKQISADSTRSDAKVATVVKASAAPVPDTAGIVRAAQTTPASVTDSAQATVAGPAEEKGASGELLSALGLAVLAVLVSPFLGGLSNVIGWVIIAVGMYEAWRLTREVPFASGGPFTIARPAVVQPNDVVAVPPTAPNTTPA